MTIALVYDSIFGNTAKIAQAIADELGKTTSVKLLAVHEARTLDLGDKGLEMLIVGSPTRGFRPTPQISEFCEGLVLPAGRSLAAAAFDTRIGLDTIHPAPLRWVVEAGGFAADRIAQMLGHRGLAVQGRHEGFVVTGTEGPLKDGEITRAQAWARSLVASTAGKGERAA